MIHLYHIGNPNKTPIQHYIIERINMKRLFEIFKPLTNWELCQITTRFNELQEKEDLEYWKIEQRKFERFVEQINK